MSIVDNKLASLYEFTKQNTMVGFFTRTYKTKYNKDGPLF